MHSMTLFVERGNLIFVTPPFENRSTDRYKVIYNFIIYIYIYIYIYICVCVC